MPSAKELDQMLKNYQAGRGVNSNVEEVEDDFVPNFDDNPNPYPVAPSPFDYYKASGMGHGKMVLGPMGEALIRANEDASTRFNAPGMLEAGWGEKPRYDTRSGYYDGMNVEDARAKEQSAFWKVGNGALKGVVTAGTTAVNTVAGTAYGAVAGLFELGNQVLSGQGIDLKKVLDAGVNNRLSEQMMKLQQLSEEWFPNYRTEQEQSEQYQKEWWKHIGTANFIGDSFLKNFGFTVGAMIGGAAWSSLLGKAMQMKASNDLLRGAIAAANGDAEASNALKEALRILKETGGRADTVIPENILKNLSEAAKGFRKKSALLQLAGSAIAAAGEGTTEGVMAKNEFLDEYMPRMEREYAQAYNEIMQDVIDEHPEWCEPGIGYDKNGQLSNHVPVLTDPRGFEEVANRQKQMTQKYQELQMHVQDQGERLAGTTFLLNIPLLTASNTIEFGRMFSGGWKTARKAIATTGDISIENNAIKSTLEHVKKNVGLQAAKTSAKVGLSEMSEEMFQGTFSSGAKKVADDRLTAFNDDGYDPEQVEAFGNWMKSMYEGGKDYLLDIKNWQEGFMGLVTGLVGVPGIPGVAGNAWNGGVYGAVSQARGEERANREAVAKFNENIQKPEFLERWKSYIRHMKYNQEMNDAAVKDDQYAWHTADEKQLINDIMLFDQIGRLNDLEGLIDRYADVSSSSKEELDDIRQAIAKNEDTEVNKISDKELADRVSKQAKRMKDTIQEYRQIYDELSSRVPQGTSNEQLQEIVFTAANMKRFEHRFLDMFGDVMTAIEPVLRMTADMAKDGENPVSFDQLYNEYAAFFSSALPRSRNVFAQLFKREQSLKLLSDYVSFDKELQQKVDDMTQLMHDREAFYNKLIRLENMSPEEFKEKAKTADKEEKKAGEEKTGAIGSDDNRPEVAVNASSVADVKNIFNTAPNPQVARLMVDNWRSMEDPPAPIKEFVDLYSTAQDFADFANKIMSDKLGLGKTLAYDIAMTLFNSAKSKDDFLSFNTAFLRENNGAVLDRAMGKIASIASLKSDDKEKIKHALPSIIEKLGEAYNQGARAITQEEFAEMQNLLAGVPLRRGNGGLQVETHGNNIEDLPVWTAQIVPGAAQTPAPSAGPVMAITPVSPVAPVKQVETTTSAPEDPQQFKKQTGNQVAASTPEMLGLSAAEKLAEQKDGTKRAKTYLRTAFGEKLVYDKKENGKVVKRGLESLRAALGIKKLEDRRAKLNGIKWADFEPFDDAGKELMKFLKDNHAFENIIDVKPGDRISLVINPTLGSDPNTVPILLYSGDKLVGALPGGNRAGAFVGIGELDYAVRKEYKASAELQRAEPFTFSKQTVVWGKAKGYLDLIYKEKGDVSLGENIPGYSSTAPVLAIGRDGQPMFLREVSREDRDSYMRYFESKYPNEEDRMALRGKFFYLVDNGIRDAEGRKEFTPVQLNVEHLGKKIYDEGQDERVKAIHEWFEDDLRNVLIRASERFGSDNDSLVIEETNAELRDLGKKLSELLDIHEIYFNFSVSGEGHPIISVNWENLSKDDYENAKESGDLEKLEKNTTKRVIDSAAKIDDALKTILNKLLTAKHSFQISLSSGEQASKDFQELLDDGYITVNANSLHPYNVDMFMATWDAEKGDFDLRDWQKEQVDVKPVAQAPESVPNMDVAVVSEGAETPPAPPVIEVVPVSRPDDDEFEIDDDSPGSPAPTPQPKEGSTDRQQTSIDENIDEITTVVSTPESNENEIREASVGVIAAMSQGPDKASDLKKSLLNWDHQSQSIFAHLRDFRSVFNSILTRTEKDAVSQALESVFGKPANLVDTASVLRLYNIWDMTGVAPDGDNGSLEKAFKRLRALVNTKGNFLASFDYVQSVVNERSNKNTNGPEILAISDYEDFESLPEDIRDHMKNTADEYDHSSRELQDKMLRCAGV